VIHFSLDFPSVEARDLRSSLKQVDEKKPELIHPLYHTTKPIY